MREHAKGSSTHRRISYRGYSRGLTSSARDKKFVGVFSLEVEPKTHQWVQKYAAREAAEAVL